MNYFINLYSFLQIIIYNMIDICIVINLKTYEIPKEQIKTITFD